MESQNMLGELWYLSKRDKSLVSYKDTKTLYTRPIMIEFSRRPLAEKNMGNAE